ncbi:hypothetical protein FAM09_20595 [Niastella caeni]|uniref:Thioredoxin family protein n=1 Tax=Niastella caeni TaxID=2569763 RepID=A0A4S8HRU4_9BACT|nr:hypothetical protein [Niastella caeni]THU35802.1 hypothetical protein FAM09_20595 [Niastella caeni]
MNKLKTFFSLLSMSITFLSHGQETNGIQPTVYPSKIFAVINRADWCSICKANGERFGKNIIPYASKGLVIITNDLTDDSTIEKSKAELKRSSLYMQIYETRRKGVGRMMQVCGFIHGKNRSIATGIVTFIDAKTRKVLSEKSLAIANIEMNQIIGNLLNK